MLVGIILLGKAVFWGMFLLSALFAVLVAAGSTKTEPEPEPEPLTLLDKIYLFGGGCGFVLLLAGHGGVFGIWSIYPLLLGGLLSIACALITLFYVIRKFFKVIQEIIQK